MTNLQKEITKRLDNNKIMTDNMKKQVLEYLEGDRRVFDYIWSDLSFASDFQERVLRACARISYGKTATYSELAEQIGSPKAVRAVGTALKNNPYLIMIPCHRVLPKSGKIGNYALGGDVKEQLLGFESKNLAKKY